jgi:hypothetical protein
MPKAVREGFARLGREGGLVRARRLSAEKRRAIAKKAAAARWKKARRPG